MNRTRVPRLWPLLVVAALLLAGCQYYREYLSGPRNPHQPPLCDELAQQEQSPDNLPFETIARESYGIPWKESEWTEPALFVLTSGEDISAIEQYIAPGAVAALKATDFDDAVVLAAFSGWQPHAAWGFCVTSIMQQQGEVFLHTHLVDSPIAPAAVAFYYHLLRLPHGQLPSGEVAFYLALTRHLYVNPTGMQQVIETSEEEIVSTSIRSLP
jgi:hypothetical protein